MLPVNAKIHFYRRKRRSEGACKFAGKCRNGGERTKDNLQNADTF